jgi:uncharacterized protein YwgA
MDIDAKTLILFVLDNSKKPLRGKVKLQKLIYFISEKLGLKYDFRPHYFGPYSSVVDSCLRDLLGLGFVKESYFGFGYLNDKGFVVGRYDYGLTKDGKQVLETIKKEKIDEHDEFERTIKSFEPLPDYLILSIAAKLNYLIKEKGGHITISQFNEEAEKLNWGKISAKSIGAAIHFLCKNQFIAISDGS